jgi:hypothetical protein
LQLRIGRPRIEPVAERRMEEHARSEQTPMHTCGDEMVDSGTVAGTPTSGGRQAGLMTVRAKSANVRA